MKQAEQEKAMKFNFFIDLATIPMTAAEPCLGRKSPKQNRGKDAYIVLDKCIYDLVQAIMQSSKMAIEIWKIRIQ